MSHRVCWSRNGSALLQKSKTRFLAKAMQNKSYDDGVFTSRTLSANSLRDRARVAAVTLARDSSSAASVRSPLTAGRQQRKTPQAGYVPAM
jgi:hypothetical protein